MHICQHRYKRWLPVCSVLLLLYCSLCLCGSCSVLGSSIHRGQGLNLKQQIVSWCLLSPLGWWRQVAVKQNWHEGILRSQIVVMQTLPLRTRYVAPDSEQHGPTYPGHTWHLQLLVPLPKHCHSSAWPLNSFAHPVDEAVTWPHDLGVVTTTAFSHWAVSWRHPGENASESHCHCFQERTEEL